MNYYAFEDNKVLDLIRGCTGNVLDVGCGSGRYLIPLTNRGFNVVGVEKNISVVKKNSDLGYRVILPDHIDSLTSNFDYVILSHIIEHIEPNLLIAFMDQYLEKLKRGGHLIIATPYLYDEFYDDYDHIKPYTPKAISILYSDYEQQQEKPLHRLTLRYVWHRKWPIVFRSYPGEHWFMRRLKAFINRFFLLSYTISGHFISRATGWIGIFEKV